MAEQTLLQIVQDVFRRQGLQPPTVVVASTDETVLQALGLMNEEAEELSTRGDFQQLYTLATFSSAVVTPPYRAFDLRTLTGYKNTVSMTLWNTTSRLPVIGPVSDDVWRSMLTLNVSQAQDAFKLENNFILIYPGHVVANNYSFTYLSTYLVESSGGTLQYNFLADTDVPRMPTRIVKAGLRWRWRRENGQPYAEELRTYEAMVADELNLGKIPSAVRMDDVPNFDKVAGPGLLIAAGNWNLP